MRKVAFEINKLVNAVLVLDVVDRDGSRVFLEHVQLSWEFRWHACDLTMSICLGGISSEPLYEFLLLREPSIF